jgi:tryptophan-rich sensory protein
MKFNNIIKISISIIICELAGVIGSIFTASSIKDWYGGLNKPFFNPPNWIFAPVWSLLFLLMGVSFYLVWNKKWVVKNKIGKFNKIKLNNFFEKVWNGKWQKQGIISIFFLQLILNIYWSLLFFGKHSIGGAFFELLLLWIAILVTIISFYRVSKLAAYLLLPYILWVSFAGVLNLSLWILN